MLKFIAKTVAKPIERIFEKRAEGATAQFRDHIRQVRSRTQPLKIELVASTDTVWLEAPAARQVTQFLSGLGFEAAGIVAVKGNDKAVIAGFAASHHAAYASIPKSGDRVFLSLISHFTDGCAFECANMPVPFEPPCPDWLVRQRRVGASAQELWSHFLGARPAKQMAEAAVGGFAASNVEDFFRYQAWMVERGGATREELATRYKAVGKLPDGEEGESFLNMARSDEVDRSLCNWWRLQSDAPFPLEQVLESLIIIHDEMSPDLLINAYWCATDDFKAKDTDFAAGGPREAFGRVVSSRGAKLRRVYQKRTALEADFYLPE